MLFTTMMAIEDDDDVDDNVTMMMQSCCEFSQAVVICDCCAQIDDQPWSRLYTGDIDLEGHYHIDLLSIQYLRPLLAKIITGDIDLEGNYHIDLLLYLTILLAKIRDLGHLDLEG